MFNGILKNIFKGISEEKKNFKKQKGTIFKIEIMPNFMWKLSYKRK